MPVRVLKAYDFHRWARGEGLSDDKLCESTREIESGLVDARLGGFLIKKRVGADGRGKRGGYRTIVAHRQGDLLVFLHGFDKHDKDNITPKEKKALHKLGDHYLAQSATVLAKAIRDGDIIEVRCHEQDSQERAQLRQAAARQRQHGRPHHARVRRALS
jgi:hypothetical protein